MATYIITLNYPDGQAQRIMTALKDAAGASTNAQAVSWFDAGVRARLRDIVLAYEREQASTTALAGVSPVAVT